VRPKPAKAKDPAIAELTGQGYSAKRCCRILGVAASGFFMWRRRPSSPHQIRLAWLADLIRAIHTHSRGTYGWRRVNAELVYGHGVIVNRKTVRKIMRTHGLHGLPGARKAYKRKADTATAADLVERCFDRPAPDQLWVTDITEHLAWGFALRRSPVVSSRGPYTVAPWGKEDARDREQPAP
jgi:putative transposase